MKAWFRPGPGAALLSCLCLSGFLACSPDPDRTNFNYLRSPTFFRADTTLTENPLCDATHPFASREECLAAKKYQLTWSRPEDTANLLGYRIYLDTLHNPEAPPGKTWTYVRDRPELANIIVESRALKDTVVFVFGNGGFKPDTLKHGNRKILLVDSVLRAEDKSGKLVFGLVPVYGGDVTPGQPQYAYFKTTDKDPPDPFHPRIKPMAKQVAVDWERPTDRVSFFNPSQDTGLIRGYRLKVGLAGRKDLERRKAFRPKLLSYLVGNKDMSGAVTDSLDNDTLPESIVFRLPDSNRAAKRFPALPADSLHLMIGNLSPQDSLTFALVAIDSNGNQNDTAMEKVTIHMTDTTQPSKPVLSVDSLSRNGFIVSWTASRDSIQDGESRFEGPHPNYQIQKYVLTRILLRAPGEKTTDLDRIDTSIVPALADSLTSKFSLPMKYLPPGTPFHLRLTAVDVTGFESDTDTLTVATDSVRFAGEDSALACPAGFIPIPRGAFKLGDESAAADPDEKDGNQRARTVSMGPFCIEPYEHRDSTAKRFVSNVTFAQAEKACEDIDADFETRLCSEAEWERSCEGPFTDSSALLHGIQSENKNPAILQASCNQAANDSAMAMSFELRNSVCLTTEGVYDMAGNLSEWVRDPYVARAYDNVDSALTHESIFADPAGAGRFGIRGGNYLKPNLPQSAIQKLARCSNRDFAQQVRPLYRDDCRSPDSVKIAVIYGTGIADFRCIDVPKQVKDLSAITDMIPSPQDSTDILVFLKGSPTPETAHIVPDSAIKGSRPLSARLTTRALAVVNFVKATGDTAVEDTLDAGEMRDTSQANLARIFRREAGNSEWSVEKNPDGSFKIKYLYAYTVPGAKPARPFYSSRAIGFRCCSKAKAPAAKVTAR
ncbi:MAG TPA: SUMF1/EgtB/PvdO family nonheme iron enzyme [Fibrobacteria bacterium]|nr:SUMF1/EgtB/PvdO family nonheme iron enzyme [Fibrobacteria bacterium]